MGSDFIRPDPLEVPRRVWNFAKGVWEHPRVQRAFSVAGSSPGPGAIPYMPSRDATLRAAGAIPGNLPEGSAAPSPGSTPGVDPRPETDESIAGERRGLDPTGQGSSQRNDPGSADTPLPKIGKGQEAVFERDVASRDLDTAETGRIRKVTKADGSVVYTNLADDEIVGTDPQSDMASGRGGSAYVQPGGEMEAAAAIPDATADRSPGWALRQVLNKMHASGDLSMDPRDIEDRRRYESQDEAQEIQKEVLRARADREIAGPASEAGASEMVEQASIQDRIEQARDAYFALTAQLDAHYQSPDTPERKAIIDRLMLQRREIANLLQGFMLKDPRQADPMAAALLALGSRPPSAGEP